MIRRVPQSSSVSDIASFHHSSASQLAPVSQPAKQLKSQLGSSKSSYKGRTAAANGATRHRAPTPARLAGQPSRASHTSHNQPASQPAQQPTRIEQMVPFQQQPSSPGRKTASHPATQPTRKPPSPASELANHPAFSRKPNVYAHPEVVS